MFQYPQAKICPSGQNVSITPFCILLFPPMRLTYSDIYSYENKCNLIGGKASNNFKKIYSYNLS